MPTLTSRVLYGIRQGMIRKYIVEVPPARFWLYFVAVRTILNLAR